MFISSRSSDKQLSVVVDRSEGASSIVDGTVEIMVHRYFFYCFICAKVVRVHDCFAYVGAF